MHLAHEHCSGAVDEYVALFEVLGGDPRWINNEFEAIVAAEWPRQRRGLPRHPEAVMLTSGGAGRAHSARDTPHVAPVDVARAPGMDGWGRERSPPRRATVDPVSPAPKGRW